MEDPTGVEPVKNGTRTYHGPNKRLEKESIKEAWAKRKSQLSDFDAALREEASAVDTENVRPAGKSESVL